MRRRLDALDLAYLAFLIAGAGLAVALALYWPH